jgi:hypothetical protein
MTYYICAFDIGGFFIDSIQNGDFMMSDLMQRDGIYYLYNSYNDSNTIQVLVNKHLLNIKILSNEIKTKLYNEPKCTSLIIANNISCCYIILCMMKIKECIMKYIRQKRIIGNFIYKHIVYRPDSPYIKKLANEFSIIKIKD